MNKDLVEQTKVEMVTDIENGDVKAFTDKLTTIVDNATKEVMAKYDELKDCHDEDVLASRGLKALTGEEKSFYNGMIESIKNAGVANIDLALPVTTEDRIFEDLKVEHPILSKIDFINSRGLTEWLVTTEYSSLYSWGALCDAVKDENSATIAKITFQNYKLSAWMPVCLTAIELGLTWLDLYVRTILKEIIAEGLVDGIINGDGDKKPVGMVKTINVESQTVPAVDKTPETITDLTPATLGGIASTLTNDGKRTVANMIMVVNPVDYLEKVMPAITVMAGNGAYTQYLPFPVEIVQEPKCPKGKAIFGIAKNYFATLGLGKEGKITYSDDFKFLDDVRCYKAKLVAYGTPKDDNSFVVADITGLKPAYITVKQA